MASCLTRPFIYKAIPRLSASAFRLTSRPSSIKPTNSFNKESLLVPRQFTSSATVMDKESAKVETTKGQADDEHPASHQAGTSTEGKHEWKTRPPYSIHKDNDKFDVKYEASCHCGRVKYQLSRDEPLDSKLCHCTTCQVQHGTWRRPQLRRSFRSILR